MVLFAVAAWVYMPLANGSPGVSESVEESRQKGVLVRQLPTDGKILASCWIENAWYYTNSRFRVRPDRRVRQVVCVPAEEWVDKIKAGAVRTHIDQSGSPWTMRPAPVPVKRKMPVR